MAFASRTYFLAEDFNIYRPCVHAGVLRQESHHPCKSREVCALDYRIRKQAPSWCSPLEWFCPGNERRIPDPSKLRRLDGSWLDRSEGLQRRPKQEVLRVTPVPRQSRSTWASGGSSGNSSRL